uniref:Sacsin/Nov domain-containing protein n=1 Tax=Knipowitschia caucasica TaxID=637954 RepID=A0AAV2K058_KNICA
MRRLSFSELRCPALYAYNNAEFTDEDWKGIQNVARSVKRDDPNKVGRFGLGFNSVYHITDLTSILSAGHLGMMDPQEQVFGAKTGELWSLDDEDHQQEFTTMHDQFQPFQDIVALGYTEIKSITLRSDELKETKWLVTSCTLTEGNVDRLDDLAEKLKFVPRVDLAFPCTDHIDCSRSRLCCFLPLPNNDSNKTGLPVYVNAYFGLTDNRRHIKWQEEDQMNDEHAIWNELLIKEVLPETYLTILRDAIKLVQNNVLPASSIYNLWPDLSQVQHKEKWHEVALDVLRQLFDQNIAVLSLAKDERQFIKLSEAVFPCNGPTQLDTLDAIKRVLVSRDENLVTLSDSVTRALKTAYPDFSSLSHVTPAFLRGVLQEGVQDISDEDRRTLLEYVLSDEQYEELDGLQLLPLSDGSFKSFTDSQDDTALIDSDTFPRTLLPFCQSLFIPDDLSPECVDHLRQLSDQDLFMVINIDKDKVLRWTKSHLPEDWKNAEETFVTWEMSNFRVHDDDPESLIDPDMKLCQGPCVWAFNNEQFSPDDWDNIVKVGSASKEDMVEKIDSLKFCFDSTDKG